MLFGLIFILTFTLSAVYTRELKTETEAKNRETIEAVVNEAFKYYSPPTVAGSKYFTFGSNEQEFYVKNGLNGNWKVLLSNPLPETGGDSKITATFPSPSGDIVAYAHSYHGRKAGYLTLDTFHFRKTDDGVDLNDVLHNVYHSHNLQKSLAWATGGLGIFYTSNSITPFTATAPEAPASIQNTTFLFYHELGTAQDEDILIAKLNTVEMLALTTTEDGQYLVVEEDVIESFFERSREGKIFPSSGYPTKNSIYVIDICQTQRTSSLEAITTNNPPIVISPNLIGQFLGKIGTDFYFKVHNYSAQIRKYDLSSTGEQNFSTILKVAESEDIIGFGIVNSTYLVIDYFTQDNKRTEIFLLKNLNLKPRVIPTSGAGTFPIAFETSRTDTRIILSKFSLASKLDAYQVDLSDSHLSHTKILLPGRRAEIESQIQTTVTELQVSDGIVPVAVLYNKGFVQNGHAPSLFLIKSMASTSETSLFRSFMELFQGVVVVLDTSCFHSAKCSPSIASPDVIQKAMEYVVEEKYSSLDRMTVAPGSLDYAILVAELINKHQAAFAGSLVLDGISPYIWNTLDAGSRLPNVTVYEQMKIDMGLKSDNKKYEFQYMAYLASFPKEKFSSKSLVANALGRYADLLSFISNKMKYEVTKSDQ